MASHIERRKFLATLGGAAVAWPLAARAQRPSIPVIGFLATTAADSIYRVSAFRDGLKEAGFIDGHNVAIEFRWAENRYDRLPGLAADLVRRPVAVIAAISGTPSALAAKAATATIPIVFAIGGDPVTPGLVASLNRPGGNVTGASFLTNQGPKRLELLRQVVPKATTIGVLVNPHNPPSESERANVQAAAHAIGQQTKVLNASTEGDIDRAFTAIVEQRIGALLVTGDPFFANHRVELVRWRHATRCPRCTSCANSPRPAA
jgi:putative ABC transport system substrate-binding protein